LDDEHLTLGEANDISSANTDKNLVVTVDASKLEVRQSTAFSKKGRAKVKLPVLIGSCMVRNQSNKIGAKKMHKQNEYSKLNENPLINCMITIFLH
jgi:hypothetical protein